MSGIDDAMNALMKQHGCLLTMKKALATMKQAVHSMSEQVDLMLSAEMSEQRLAQINNKMTEQKKEPAKKIQKGRLQERGGPSKTFPGGWIRLANGEKRALPGPPSQNARKYNRSTGTCTLSKYTADFKAHSNPKDEEVETLESGLATSDDEEDEFAEPGPAIFR
jgi:hypothetical protein